MNSFFIALVLGIAGGAIGQLLMKAGLQGLSQMSWYQLPLTLWETPSRAWLLSGGIGVYLFSVLVWIHALKRYDLSFAYPLLSLGYVLVYIWACTWPGLDESFTLQKTVGVLLIVVGVTISSQKHFPARRKSSNAKKGENDLDVEPSKSPAAEFVDV